MKNKQVLKFSQQRHLVFILAQFCLLFPVSFYVTAEENNTPVITVKAIMAPIYEEIPLTGSVTSRRVSLLSPKVDGFVSELKVDEGDDVKTGEPLLLLDRVMAEIELKKAQANINEAKARLKEFRRQRDEADKLVKKNHIAASSFEATLANVEINEAILQRLRTEFQEQQEQLRRHTIYAPFDGVIARKLVEKGQWVETSTALLELVENDILRVDVPVPQHYFNHVEPGSPVLLKFDAFPDQQFDATVTMKIPVGSDSARTFPVKIEINNKDRLLAPGMSASVRIQLKQSNTDPVLLLPRDAIVKQADGTESVWVVAETDGVQNVSSITVHTGRHFLEYVEIKSAHLEEGDRVVVRGNEILRPGQLVKITEELEINL